MRKMCLRTLGIVALAGFCATLLMAKEPEPTAKNTISLSKGEPIRPQAFARPLKFFVDKSLDRSGNPRPMLMQEKHGGVFLDREPALIVREAIEDSLAAAGMRAADANSCDYIMDVYVFHFGLAEGLGTFGKVDIGGIVRDPKAGRSQNITAMGTSLGKKGNDKQRIKATLEEALHDAVRNLLRGTQLQEAIAAFESAKP